jgi:hypothetical protein
MFESSARSTLLVELGARFASATKPSVQALADQAARAGTACRAIIRLAIASHSTA